MRSRAPAAAGLRPLGMPALPVTTAPRAAAVRPRAGAFLAAMVRLVRAVRVAGFFAVRVEAFAAVRVVDFFDVLRVEAFAAVRVVDFLAARVVLDFAAVRVVAFFVRVVADFAAVRVVVFFAVREDAAAGRVVAFFAAAAVFVRGVVLLRAAFPVLDFFFCVVRLLTAIGDSARWWLASGRAAERSIATPATAALPPRAQPAAASAAWCRARSSASPSMMLITGA